MTYVDDKPAREAAEVNFDAVARVASVVELRDVALRSSHCSINIPAPSVPSDWAADAFVGFDAVADGLDTNAGELSIQTAFVVVFKAGSDNEVLTEPPEYGPDNPPDIEIQASFELLYSIPESPSFTDEDLVSFAIANGTLHAWPYWREFADSAAQRMRLPRLMIGVFKLPSSHDPFDEVDSDASSTEGSADQGA